MSANRHGFLLIADITGYTVYLTQSELDHAQEVLTALLNLLVDHARPPLVISRLAGDAVISYALQRNTLSGQTFVEMLEETYVAFRRAIELMVLNNTCHCKACLNISTLDLKFFVHYGAFVVQRLDAHDELLGSDVILIHRLLKNRVTEELGIRAYTLYTDQAIRALGLEGFCEKLIAHEEEYEHLGKVQVWVQNMHPVWEERRAASRLEIPPTDIAIEVETDIALAPHIVWEYLTRPECRSVLMGSDRQQVLNLRHGRLAPGSAFQCYHGKRITTQTIVEWRPFEQMVSEDLIPLPNTHVLTMLSLQATPSGTRLTQRISKGYGPFFGRTVANLMIPTMQKKAQKDIEKFRDRIEQEAMESSG